ncbi:chitin-binding domain protein cbd-1 [Drosophila eugracilis]|uniref:chitin-binding domain protein cbd-1 n=1 Tax=Drosophila eugracilis TaxID=29029 RepID=UPI001BD93710|nr:chitin-binding domain protein cbd-1 [Drosophila eugracilis]
MKLVLLFLGGLLILECYPTYGELYPCSADAICVCSGHQAGDLLPDCDDCSGYILCGIGSYEKEKCPAGQIFSLSLNACAPGQCPRSDGQCSSSNTPGGGGSSAIGTCYDANVKCSYHGENIPHPQHCQLFCTCVESTPVLRHCERGMWFDRENFVCDFPQNVKNCPANRD